MLISSKTPWEQIPADADHFRIVSLSCAHSGFYVHKPGTHECVDGRNALEHLQNLNPWIRSRYADDDIPTFVVNHGDMTLKPQDKDGVATPREISHAIDVLHTVTTPLLIANHVVRLMSREQASEIAGSPGHSFAAAAGRAGLIFSNPPYCHEVKLAKGLNLLPDHSGRDWAETHKGPAKVIRNYIPLQHAEEHIYPFLAAHPNIQHIIEMSHGKASWRANFETLQEDAETIQQEKMELPPILICEGGQPYPDLEADSKGRFIMVHREAVLAEVSKRIGNENAVVAGIYGDDHPRNTKIKVDENGRTKVVVAAFSQAIDDRPPAGNVAVTEYKNGTVTVTRDQVPYPGSPAAQAAQEAKALAEINSALEPA
jgi:hypothetical protein